MHKNATYAFLDSLQVILEYGSTINVRGSEIKELRSQVINIQSPTERVYVVPKRKNNIFGTIAEAVWVLAGRNDVSFLSHYLPRAPEFSDDGKVWRAGYGARLRNWQGVDQIEEVARLLRDDPNTRRAVLILFDPAQDYIESKDIPCNNWLHFLIRDNRLHLSAAIRSNDVMWGFSGINTFEWSLLQEMMAFWTGSQVGEFSYFISSFHLYSRHYDRVQEMIAYQKEKTLYDFGFSSAPFSTPLDHFDEVLARWFDIESRMQVGEKGVFEAITTIDDSLLRNCLEMLYIYNKHLAQTDIQEIAELVASLPSNDFKIAAIEYFARAWGDARLIKMTNEESQYFEYFWSDSRDVPTHLAEPYSFQRVFNLLSILHYKKTLVYKDSWKRRGEVIGVFANISRKFDRIESIFVEGTKATSDESILDTIADLAVYATKYLTYLAEHYSQLFEVFIQQYPPAEPIEVYSDNLNGFDAVAGALVRRYTGSELWKGVLTYQDCYQIINRNYTEMEELLVKKDWRRSDPLKCIVAADLAISAVHYLVLLSEKDPAMFQPFVKHIENL